MADFLDRADEIARRPGVWDGKDDFRTVFTAVADLQAVHAKAYLDLDNIEVLFGAFEMGLLLQRMGVRGPKEIADLRRALVTVIVQTLEATLRFPIRDRRLEPPEPYASFVRMLLEVQRRYHAPDMGRFSFLTFNYDLALDYALHRAHIPFDYGLQDASNRVSYLPR